MNRVDVGLVEKEKDFFVFNNKQTRVFFSTAENDRNFNRHIEGGKRNLEKLKKIFNIEEVVYIRQVHSDIIYTYDGVNREEFIELEGDAIITKQKKVAIGVFTADCVPVIIVDEEKEIVAAVHSGWKGTFKSITKKVIEKMQYQYNCNVKNIKIYIGPHIKQCCYEVSEELKQSFLEKNKLSEDELFHGRNLSMEKYIIQDIKELGIKEENITSINLCTYCSDEVKLYSYRKSNGAYGRLFAFAIID